MEKKRIKLSDAERAERHRTAMRKYYSSNKGKFKGSYKANRKKRLAYDRMYRDLHRDAYLLKQKIYNDTKRKKS